MGVWWNWAELFGHCRPNNHIAASRHELDYRRNKYLQGWDQQGWDYGSKGKRNGWGCDRLRIGGGGVMSPMTNDNDEGTGNSERPQGTVQFLQDRWPNEGCRIWVIDTDISQKPPQCDGGKGDESINNSDKGPHKGGVDRPRESGDATDVQQHCYHPQEL